MNLKLPRINTDKVLSSFFHLISIGLNVFAFFNILKLNSLIPQIVIASFGASLVFLQIDSLRKWKSTKNKATFLTYIICTFFSLMSTGYVVTSFSTTKAVTRDSEIVNIEEDTISNAKAILRYEATNSRLEANLLSLESSKVSLEEDKEFYGDNFFTLKKDLASNKSDIDSQKLVIADKITLNNTEIAKLEADSKVLRAEAAPLNAEKASDIFTQLSDYWDIPLTLITGFIFFLLASILELGIFTLTPAANISEAEENETIKDLLEEIDTLETKLAIAMKTNKKHKRVHIDTYIDALFSSNSKKLVNREDVARVTRFDLNVCDDYWIKLTTKSGLKGFPFIQVGRGRGTYSEYTKDEIKEQLKGAKIR